MASPEEQSFVMNRQNSHKPLTHPTPWVALHKIEGFAVWVSGIIYETRLFSHQSSDNLFFLAKLSAPICVLSIYHPVDAIGPRLSKCPCCE